MIIYLCVYIYLLMCMCDSVGVRLSWRMYVCVYFSMLHTYMCVCAWIAHWIVQTVLAFWHSFGWIACGSSAYYLAFVFCFFAIFVLANHRMLKGFESFSFQLNETNFENFCYSCCAMAVSSYVSLIIFVNMCVCVFMYVCIFVWLFSICRSNAFLTSRRNKMNAATSTVW